MDIFLTIKYVEAGIQPQPEVIIWGEGGEEVKEYLENLKNKIKEDKAFSDSEKFDLKLEEKAWKEKVNGDLNVVLFGIVLFERSGAPHIDRGKIEHIFEKGCPVCIILEEIKTSLLIDILKDFPKVAGIFNKEKLLSDYEDLGKFISILKDRIRISLPEESTFGRKPVEWKVKRIESEEGGEPLLFLSFFMDTRMRKFMESVSAIAAALKEQMKKITETLKNYSINKEGIDKWYTGITENKDKEKYSRFNEFFLQASKEKIGLRPYHVLLLGESGTGKSFLVRMLTRFLYEKDENSEPVYFNCSTFSKEILDVELFGGVKGTFTDSKTKPGVFLKNIGDIIFLDEIGDLPTGTQQQLLVYLEDFVFRPVGWYIRENIFSPTIVIAATNRNLQSLIREGKFREDLYYRFKIRLKVPPLRERKDDVKMLVSFLLQDPYINPDRRVRYISYRAIQILMEYPYEEGNFRELETILKNSVEICLTEELIKKDEITLKEIHILKAIERMRKEV